MIKTKTEVLQIRIDADLLERYRRYAEMEGYHVSVAIRRSMKATCDQYEQYLAKLEAERQHRLNK